MTRTPRSRRARPAGRIRRAWPAMIVLAAALVLGGGAPAGAGLVGGARAAGAAGGGASPDGVCAKTAAGELADCPVPAAAAPPGAADSAPVTAPVSDPAALVDTRTWTSGGGNTFPGADVPFGMVQWSPDTRPGRSDGGGYTYGDKSLTGYSLTHVSGPGCKAAGDVPILPWTGGMPRGNPTNVLSSFENRDEVAQAGYYSARSDMPNTIISQFTATPHSAMGRFTFPRTSRADFLIKLNASQRGDTASSARIVGRDEVTGSDTSGDFCDESGSGAQSQLYTVYFNIVFDHPFTASRVITAPGRQHPGAVFLTFNARANRVIQAKVGISYVSTANARRNWHTENPGWNFDRVKNAAQRSWNGLLGKISVSGGSFAQTQEFYSLLYKDFLQPNIISDVNGQYVGSDLRVHQFHGGQRNQYGMFSGWDVYHSLAPLQAMLDPRATGDMAQSLVNYYAQNRILPQWAYLNLDNYIMVGDPSDAIIADYYAFGARNFNTSQALTDMVRQATTVNDVRPGEGLEARDGYLPQDGRYGCCNAHGSVASLLEYDTADFALSQFAGTLGDHAVAARLQNRAGNWANVFDHDQRLLVPRNSDGRFVDGVTPTSGTGFVEGDAYEYLWDVPNDYAGLFSLLGGDQKVAGELRTYLSKPNASGRYAKITNEFDLGEQNAPDYARDPAAAQQAVATIRDTVYRPGPSGLANNDDLGAESSQFIWEMLGLYPENPGSDNVVLTSPGFPHAVITLPSGAAITISADGASPSRFYATALTINGRADSRLYVPFSTLARGSTMDWTLGTSPSSWGSAPGDAPPSYGKAR